MVIAPNERAFLLFEGEKYTLRIMSVDSDDNYYTPVFDTVTVTAENGVLSFEYAFGKEQEYLIHLYYAEKVMHKFNVYALDEDLYALTPLRGDLHSHSYRSDGRRDPAALAGHFREQGYDFFALTDHNRFYPGGEIDEVYAGINCGFKRVIGEEVHAPQITVHVVHIGGRESVCEKYLNNREGYENEVKALLEKVPENVPEIYRERYAKVMWVAEKIHSVGGIAIFPHPFWRPGEKTYNVTSEFARILLKSGMFDAYELIGGMLQPDINSSVAMWNDMRAEGLEIPVVGSSDVHILEATHTFPHYFTIAFAKENSTEGVTEAIKNFMTVAVEACGEEYKRQYRAYGSYRLVTYAQFLFKHYFPLRQRMCQGEGYAMRAYSMGEVDGRLIELEAEMTNSFKDRFFGRKPPILPSREII
ncbi:MAG: PHP domain-containing protein, partial [Clostridia bacterium]|nr:PHP domain-containing protein [Clostridia bacterium]